MIIQDETWQEVREGKGVGGKGLRCQMKRNDKEGQDISSLRYHFLFFNFEFFYLTKFIVILRGFAQVSCIKILNRDKMSYYLS